jgi:thiol-disulfide isomerase/thioredoxin
MRRLTLTIVLLLLAGSAVAQSPEQKALNLKDIHGRQLSLAAYKGKVVLINFWATWCIPCRSEIPDLVQMQRQYRAQDLRIIGITYPPEKISEVRRFVQELKVNYRIAMGTKATKALFTASETLPMTVVIDRQGAVRDVIEGIMYSDEFDQKVKPVILSEPVPTAKASRH